MRREGAALENHFSGKSSILGQIRNANGSKGHYEWANTDKRSLQWDAVSYHLNTLSSHPSGGSGQGAKVYKCTNEHTPTHVSHAAVTILHPPSRHFMELVNPHSGGFRWKFHTVHFGCVMQPCNTFYSHSGHCSSCLKYADAPETDTDRWKAAFDALRVNQ